MKPWILERAARTPSAPALEAGGRSQSYAELAARAAARAAALARLGIGPGECVAVLMGNRMDFAEWLHAATLARAILVPLNARLTPAELARQIADAGAPIVVHDESDLAAKAGAAAAEARAKALASRELEAGGAPVATAELALYDPAVIVYTSGTSGEPKGVVLTHGNLLAAAVGSAFHVGALPSDRWLACLPLFHVGGLAILARSALAGSAVVLHERFDPERVSRALDADGITLASLVPTMLARVLEVRGATPPPASLRAVLLGGAGAPAPLLERAAAAGWPLLPTYGLTEACSQVATLPPGEPVRADGGGLRPLHGVEIRVTDERGAEVASGTAGEIRVRGATVSPGYWGSPDATARAIQEGWLRSGDLGVVEADGSLRVVGRADDRLITGGENVHPSEVEGVLAAHPDVVEVAVAGLPDPLYGARIAAWVVLSPGARATHADLERFARARLAGYKVPRAWHTVAELPRNAGGKLVRRELGPLAR